MNCNPDMLEIDAWLEFWKTKSIENMNQHREWMKTNPSKDKGVILRFGSIELKPSIEVSETETIPSVVDDISPPKEEENQLLNFFGIGEGLKKLLTSES